MQDGFMLWQMPEYDTVLDCKRKTEMIANAKLFNQGLQISFSDSWSVAIKGNKRSPLAFHSGAWLRRCVCVCVCVSF